MLIMRRGAADVKKEVRRMKEMKNVQKKVKMAAAETGREERKRGTLLDRAIEFAAVKHAGQPRKGTRLPYFTHVMEAMEIVCRMTEDEEVRAAAVLHDTLEDTQTTKEELVRNFGQRVADLVAAESENKREDKPAGETWLTRKLETIEHMRTAPTEIRMIALGDKLSNVRAMTRDYRIVGEQLWQRFNEKNPLYHGMYYGELANAFCEDETIRKTDAYREYVELCGDLFGKEYDGDGNLIVEDGQNEQEAGKEEGLDIRCFYADDMDEIRDEMPAGTKAWCLILDRTEDADLLEIQKMAMTLDALMRTEDTGFGDVHLKIANEPGMDDVSWERTEDGYALYLCAESGKNWCQVAYQLGYLMTHCLIDHLDGERKEGISWAEELICEASAIELLDELGRRWEETPFGQEDPGYQDAVGEYIADLLGDKGNSALLRCRDRDELVALNDRNDFTDRLDESHDLYNAMDPSDITELARVRKYEADSLLMHTRYWRPLSEGSRAVDYICRLQERIDGCAIPAGIYHEIKLKDSKPTGEQVQVYKQMIRALRDLPGEWISFAFLDFREEKGQIGLVYYDVLREKDGRICAAMRVDTKDGIRYYRTITEEDRAVGFLEQILEKNEVPDTKDWEDLTDSAVEAEEDGDMNEFDMMEQVLHPDGRENG